MELMREADSNDITDSSDVTACCSHEYTPAVGMYVHLFFILSSYLSVCRVSTLFYLNTLCLYMSKMNVVIC